MKLLAKAILVTIVLGMFSSKAYTSSYTHLAPEDTVYYVEGSLADLETVLGYQATDMLIQLNRLALSEEGETERNKEPFLTFGYDLSLKFFDYLHQTYSNTDPIKRSNGRYAFYLDGLFPVFHFSSSSSKGIFDAFINDAKVNDMAIRTESWGDSQIWYIALTKEPDKDVGLLELTMVLVGDQLTLSVTSGVMPLVRKMKVLGLVPDTKPLSDSKSRFARMVNSTPDEGMHGYLNVVNLGRLFTANPSTTAGIDLNLYFSKAAKDMGFRKNKGVCTQELDDLLALTPRVIGRLYVDEKANKIEMDSSAVVEVEDRQLAEQIHSLNGELRLLEDSGSSLFDVAAAFNFTDASWKLLALKGYLESYEGECPEIVDLYEDILRDVEFTEIALMASFAEGVNGFNAGVSSFEINEEVPIESKIQGYASISTVNLNILRSLIQLAPEEYRDLMPEPGTSKEIDIPDLPPQLGLVMHASETELTAIFGTENLNIHEPPRFEIEPGILAVNLDLAEIKQLYSQIPGSAENCEDHLHGKYIIDRFADQYSLKIGALEDGIEIANQTSVKRPQYAFSNPLGQGKYEFQYADKECQWKTIDVIDVRRKGPYTVQLADIADDCSFVDASWDMDIKKGVSKIKSSGKYRSSCDAKAKSYSYEFACVIESRNSHEIVCSNPKDGSFYRLLEMGMNESTLHQQKLDQHEKVRKIARIKEDQAEVLSFVKDQNEIQKLDINKQVEWGKLAKSFSDSFDEPVKPTSELSSIVDDVNKIIEPTKELSQLLEIEFDDDCWVEIQNSEGTMLVADLKSAGDSISIYLKGGGQVLLGRSSAATKFFWNGKSVDLEPYTRKDIARLSLHESTPHSDVEKEIIKKSSEEQIMSALAYIQNEVRKRWVRPADARNGMEVEVRIHLVPTGEIINIEVTYRSSDATGAFVNSVIKAVTKAGRFDRLANLDPVLFDANFRTFKIIFRPEDLRL